MCTCSPMQRLQKSVSPPEIPSVLTKQALPPLSQSHTSEKSLSSLWGNTAKNANSFFPFSNKSVTRSILQLENRIGLSSESMEFIDLQTGGTVPLQKGATVPYYSRQFSKAAWHSIPKQRRKRTYTWTFL